MSFHHQGTSPIQRSSAPSPCAKGCGFFGSPDTQNMCSVCFKKHLLATGEPQAETSTAAAASKAVVAPSAVKTTGYGDAADASSAVAEAGTPVEQAAVAGAGTSVEEEALKAAERRQKAWSERCRAAVAENYWGNRCSHCLKKMTLAGRFTCRCGRTYCPTHRHSEAHACAYDYQRAGRVAISRSNPLVEGEKLRDRI